MAKLYFRYGTMGSGKSIDLLKVAYNYEERNQKCLVVVPELDNRYGVGKITTRIGISRDAYIVYSNTNIYEYIEKLENKPDCILVDECNFVTKKQILELSDVVDLLNIPVICYGLRSDFKGELFESTQQLMAIADKIEEIKTICECGAKAVINMRYIDGKVVIKGDKILIGGNESYKAVCRKCYKKYIKRQK